MPIVLPESNDSESEFHAFRKKVFCAAEDSIGLFTLPISHHENGKLQEIRTGFLLRLGDMRFLITAGHDMREHYEAGKPPYAVFPDEKIQPALILAEDPGFLTTKDSREDLTVVRLRDETVKSLEGHYDFCRLDQIDAHHISQRPPSLYLLYGYPVARIQKDANDKLVANTWKYLTIPYQHEIPEIANENPEYHEFYSYDRVTRSDEGVQVDPNGLSGCGIYFCGMPQTHQPFSHEYFRLVAVQTSWNRTRQYVKSTSVRVVLTIIWKYFSDSRDILRMHGYQF
ncbi:hypothetical protein Pla52o_25120 [Novipirellula galeiformis]|uniref:Trypsin n=1 Tax=Novipirellula galeiformis TaxID=2528004 RepID=A0A5C6CFB5_9BACT|nr:hypothetical protein [Novipirellula galeiformis]TWU22978.1 hypothetical protein Pla52o_25120 [Novipirellula galeiformis]